MAPLGAMAHRLGTTDIEGPIGKLGFRVGKSKSLKPTYNQERHVGKLGFRVGIININQHLY